MVAPKQSPQTCRAAAGPALSGSSAADDDDRRARDWQGRLLHLVGLAGIKDIISVFHTSKALTRKLSTHSEQIKLVASVKTRFRMTRLVPM